MAARNYTNPKCLVRETVEIFGSFAPQGAGALVATDRKGLGYTIARTSAGLFTITLTDKYADLVSAHATVQLAAAADINAQFGTYTAASKTITLRLIAVATETDVAANANNRVHFVLRFRNSQAVPVRGS